MVDHMTGQYGNEHAMTFVFHIPKDGTESTVTLDWNGAVQVSVLPGELESVLVDAFGVVYDGLHERL